MNTERKREARRKMIKRVGEVSLFLLCGLLFLLLPVVTTMVLALWGM